MAWVDAFNFGLAGRRTYPNIEGAFSLALQVEWDHSPGARQGGPRVAIAGGSSVRGPGTWWRPERVENP